MLGVLTARREKLTAVIVEFYLVSHMQAFCSLNSVLIIQVLFALRAVFPHLSAIHGLLPVLITVCHVIMVGHARLVCLVFMLSVRVLSCLLWSLVAFPVACESRFQSLISSCACVQVSL